MVRNRQLAFSRRAMGFSGLFSGTATRARLPRNSQMNVRSDFSSTFLLLSLLHINEGIADMMADHVPHELPRIMIVVSNRLFLLLGFKDVFLLLLDQWLSVGGSTSDHIRSGKGTGQLLMYMQLVD